MQRLVIACAKVGPEAIEHAVNKVEGVSDIVEGIDLLLDDVLDELSLLPIEVAEGCLLETTDAVETATEEFEILRELGEGAHHLFADLLRLKLKQRQSNAIPELQTKASQWCEKQNLSDEAINYALAAHDWDRALNLIEPIAFQMISLGGFERLNHWVEAIPESAFKTRPALFPLYIPTLLYKEQFDKLEKYLQIVETIEPEPVRQRLVSFVWSTRSLLAAASSSPVGARTPSRSSAAT